MKKILLAVMSVFLLSCSGNSVCDKVVSVYENAAEKVLTANSREELRSLERGQNAECSKVLRDYAAELAEIEEKAADGNKRAVEQLRKLNDAKKLYRESKAEKRKALKSL